jgi:hypothetical protein
MSSDQVNSNNAPVSVAEEARKMEAAGTLATPSIRPTPAGPVAQNPQPPRPAAIVPSLSAAVNKAVAKTMPVPKGLKLMNTRDLSNGWFHACVYSETAARKTSTAAQFDTPENTRIILTRSEEQLLPLRDLGYQAAAVSDAQALTFALSYPEQLWPDWAARPNRTLILDDATEAVAMLLEDASEIDGKEVKDKRRSYGEAGDNLREIIKTIRRKPMNFIMVALAKVKENPLTNEESIRPDLPPSMLSMVLTELEYVFYIKTSNYKMLTERDFITVKEIDPNTNKERIFRREIFAKNKITLGNVGKQLVLKEEELDLRKFWNKVQGVGQPLGVKK